MKPPRTNLPFVSETQGRAPLIDTCSWCGVSESTHLACSTRACRARGAGGGVEEVGEWDSPRETHEQSICALRHDHMIVVTLLQGSFPSHFGASCFRKPNSIEWLHAGANDAGRTPTSTLARTSHSLLLWPTARPLLLHQPPSRLPPRTCVVSSVTLIPFRPLARLPTSPDRPRRHRFQIMSTTKHVRRAGNPRKQAERQRTRVVHERRDT